VRWVEGETALSSGSIDGPDVAAALARLLEALHWPAPADAPLNPFRGVPLAERVERFDVHLEALPDGVDRAAVASAWAEALACTAWTGAPLWLHGDLHPGNLVVRAGRLIGVVDFGDLTAGDPATDLAVAWMLLGPEDRSALRTRLGTDEATWGRARGWALVHAVAVLAHSADDPAMAAMARRTLAAVLADTSPWE
jgi:aminoglycoside phosphotransferase (APT) family kinase protein